MPAGRNPRSPVLKDRAFSDPNRPNVANGRLKSRPLRGGYRNPSRPYLGVTRKGYAHTFGALWGVHLTSACSNRTCDSVQTVNPGGPSSRVRGSRGWFRAKY